MKRQNKKGKGKEPYMIHKFHPCEYYRSTYSIPFEALYKKGIRGVLFDIDNTLVPHNLEADEKAISLFKELDAIGMNYCLISNNKEGRVKKFNEQIQAPYIYDGKKPSKKNYRKAMNMIGTDVTNTVFVGDQIFTDIWGANRTGLYSILVQSIHPKEEIQIVIKRYFEQLVLKSYKGQIKE